MERIVLRPLAKVNLGLDVVGKREDGYHEVRMVMQTLNLHDHLVMEVLQEDVITMKTNLPYLPVNDNNLVVKAVKLMKEKYHITKGVRINLKKVIPVAGGMAGGSSNAAAALLGMNLLFELHLRTGDLMKLGEQLGADVPYCVLRGTVLAEGIGEKLTTLPPAPKCGVLVVKPSVSASTKKVYEAFDDQEEVKHPLIDELINAIEQGDLHEMCKYMGNNLEPVTMAKYPIIQTIIDKMEREGALRAMMSGSGPTVFGIFEDLEKAKGAGEQFAHMKGVGQVHVTSFYNVRGRGKNYGDFKTNRK
ncbi:MAG: 4-(cytidine 5'-diphospho)-2-C-methyl-D-erythritol kinase [Lachnospiraceae bacterium]|nr:4-(cytidine 5'-diphospho)-2-C-methyl-D-erythritol kinase [Lachnospiraceae bacterium]